MSSPGRARLSADAVPITMRSSLVQAQRLGADQRTRNRRLVRPSPDNDLQRGVAKAVPLHAASGQYGLCHSEFPRRT